ncbi:hypothetical protein SUDANB95_07925 (plasmid) [Actinosynnema sp. ALI-1.44]
MKILGWTVTVARRTPAAQQRGDRNAAAMTGGVGLAALPGGTLAARIHRQEIDLAVRLIRFAAERRWVRELYRQALFPYRPDEFAATLRRRLGAAAAVEPDPQFAPILAEEIAVLEQAVADLAKDVLLGSHHHIVSDGRALLEDLHLRSGYAEAVQYLGSVAVFPGGTATPAGERGEVTAHDRQQPRGKQHREAEGNRS